MKARASRSNPAAARGAEALILLPALPRPCLVSAVRPRAEHGTRPAPCTFCSRTKAAPSLHHPPSPLQFSALRNLRGDDFCRIYGKKAWAASWQRGSIHHSSRSVSLQRTKSRHDYLPAAASQVLPALQISAFIWVQPLAAATKASGTPLPWANSGSVTKQPEHEAGMAPERAWAQWLRLLPAEPAPVRQGSSSEREQRGFGAQKTGLQRAELPSASPAQDQAVKAPAACREAGLYLAATQVQAAREGGRRVLPVTELSPRGRSWALPPPLSFGKPDTNVPESLGNGTPREGEAR